MTGRLSQLTVALLAAFITVVAGAGTAAAYFRTTGSGSGAAQTATLLPVATLTPASVSGSLYPGGTEDVVLRLSNPNDFSVTLASVTADGPVSASGGLGTCTTTGVTFDAPESFESIAALAPGETVITLPDAAVMSTSSESGCQGATFTIPVSVTVTR